MRVQLDAENWAEIKEVTELRRGDRKAVNKAIVFEGDPDTGRPIIRASMDDDMADAILAHVVTDWSFPWPLPAKDLSSIDRLTLEQDDKLREAIQPHIDAIQGKNAPVKENADPTTASAS